MEIATFAKLVEAYNGEDESLGNLLDAEFYNIVVDQGLTSTEEVIFNGIVQDLSFTSATESTDPGANQATAQWQAEMVADEGREIKRILRKAASEWDALNEIERDEYLPANFFWEAQ